MKKYGICALLLAALLLTGCANNQDVVEVPVLMDPVGVRTDTALVERQDIYTITVLEGSIVAAAEELRFDIDGTIGEVLCYPGMWVEQGDPLLVIDQTDLKKSIDSVQRQLDYTLSNGTYDDAKADIDIQIMRLELQELQQSGAGDDAVAQQELAIRQAELNLKQAQELRQITVQSLQEQLDLLNRDYGRNVLTAPFSGNVFYLDDLRVGTSVRAGKTVAYIANPNDLTMVVSTYLSEQRMNNSTMYALIGDKRYDVEYKPMTRQEMSSLILSGNSLTTQFTVVGPQEDLSEVQAGMYAALCVEGSRKENALCIPTGAIYAAAGEKYVYVITDDGRERRTVTTGVSNGIVTEITSGLQEGESVYVKD